MSSFSAKPRNPPRRVVIVVYPGVTLLDTTGPAQVFTEAAHIVSAPAPPYRIVLASKNGGSVVTDTGIPLGTVSLRKAAAQPIDTLLVSGGLGVFDAALDDDIVEWIRTQSSRARRTGSTCMGAFLTAAAGLLQGRRAATHWRWGRELQKQHPDVTVERDPIFVRDGPMWSSAGVTAGIDLALAMVEEDHGHGAALAVARRLVVFLKRPGGQAQFSATLSAQSCDQGGAFDVLHAWIADHLDADLRVHQLAERISMSARNFARLYTAQVGATPAHAVETLRIEAAKRLLEGNRISIKIVAGRCGFGDYERMRRAFLRSVGIAPSEYRERFGVNRKAHG
jgi:transcriptional regulator GlxA family with amidase domain